MNRRHDIRKGAMHCAPTVTVILFMMVLAACRPTAPDIDIPAHSIDRRAAYIAYPTEIRLDGETDDWNGIERVIVTEGNHYDTSPGNHDQFIFSLAADNGNLYLLLTTNDAEIFAGTPDTPPLQRDAFSVFFNFTDDLSLGTVIPGVVGITVDAAMIGEPPGGELLTGHNIPVGSEAIAFTTETGWAAEVRVPLHSFEAPTHGEVIGFQAYLYGADTWGGKAHLIWSRNDPDATSWYRADVFGQAIYYERGQTDLPQPYVIGEGGAAPGTWGSVVSHGWNHYIEHFILCGDPCGDNLGAVFDPSEDYLAVSEGLGYGMLLAVMLDDQPTFDRIYDAAYFTMRDESNELHHWRMNGRGRITDTYSATDAELDIALALIFAQARVDDGTWRDLPDRPYGERAQTVLDNTYAVHVVENDKLSPGTLAGFDGDRLTNPSYFAPAWFRIFDQFEEGERWSPLIDAGYELLEASPGAENALIADWMSTDGTSSIDHCRANDIDLDNCQFVMGYDAIRVPWRVGLDCLWFDEARACDWSQRGARFLRAQPPDSRARLYDLDGTLIVDYQDEAMLSMWIMGALAADDPFLAAELSEQLITFGYPPGNGYFGENADLYYNLSLGLFTATWLTGDFQNLMATPEALSESPLP
jgi:endo-1,4-beta-D-glucanase Y